MPIGGGVTLGAATGRIVIDLSDLENVRVTTQRVGQEAEQNLRRIRKGSDDAKGGIESLSSALGRLGGAFGLSLGAAGVVQLGRFAVQADALATAYRRQSVAAVDLAGSQTRLNELLRTYDRVTGGAIDRATALGDVTRLMAVGFADTTEELEAFVTAARGISVATGQQQDYVISQLQLAIANQSTLRLDQLGLGVSEVEKRITSLRAANSNLTKEMAYQQAILGLATEKFGALVKSAEAQATGAELATKAWKEFRLELGEAAGPAVGGALQGLTNEIRGISDVLQDVARDANRAGTAIRNMGSGRTGNTGDVPWWKADPLGDWMRGHELGTRPGEGLWFVDRPWRDSPGLESSGGFGGRRQRIAPEFARSSIETLTQEQGQAIREHEEALTEITVNAGEQRADATRQYEEQRSSTIRQYEQTIAREAEDFARNRARAEREFAQQIADVREDAAAREAQQVERLARQIAGARSDSNERIAEAREDTNKRLAEIDEDYHRNRERAERSHRERILTAAGRLDAVAIREEQRRFAQESRDAEEAHNEQRSDLQEQLQERLQDEKDNLDKRIRQAQEAHNEQLKDAREADDQRIQDMTADFEERKTLEDEDRAIRLERMAEDHREQLDEMARQHAQRIQQIAEHAQEERDQQAIQHNKALEALGLQTDAWIKQNQRVTNQMILDWTRVHGTVAQQAAALLNLVQQGGSHPSMADPYIDRQLPISSSGSIGPSGARSVVVQPGAIQISVPPGMNEEWVGQIIYRELLEFFGGNP